MGDFNQFSFSPLVAEEKQVTETVKALPSLETADIALPGSSNENVQTNGIPDDGQSVSSTDNLVNNSIGCRCVFRKGETFLSCQLMRWGFGEERDRSFNVCVLLRFEKEAAAAI